LSEARRAKALEYAVAYSAKAGSSRAGAIFMRNHFAALGIELAPEAGNCVCDRLHGAAKPWEILKEHRCAPDPYPPRQESQMLMAA
jgi:hypothetical protein